MPAKTMKRPKPKQKKPSHAPMAFVGDAPCEVCGSEWFSPAFTPSTGEISDVCANLWHNMIAVLRAERLLLARLAAETPQFDNPLHIYEAQTIRDRVLSNAAKVKA